MNCKNCGIELAEGTGFCTACGTKVEIEENNAVEANIDETVERNDVENQAEVVTTIKDTSDKKSFIKEILADEKKKKIFIAAIVAVVVILIVIIIALSKSGSSNNYYGNGDSGYSDYDDDFGNDEVVTQPQTTEAVIANMADDIEVKYPKDIIYYDHLRSFNDYKAIFGGKITDVKKSIDSDGSVKLQIEVEKVSQDIYDPKSYSDGELWFWLEVKFYDASGMIIDEESATLSYLPDDEPIGTKYTITVNSYSFSRDNIDIARIDIVERH